MSFTNDLKSTFGSQPKTSLALVASPSNLSTSAGLNDALEDGGIQAAKTINVLGGNSLSKFIVTTANFTSTTTTLIDTSTFNGEIDLLLAKDDFDSTLTIKGGTSANDEVNVEITDTAEKIGSMTGVEKLVVSKILSWASS